MQAPTLESAPPDQPFAVIQVTGELDLDTQDGFEAEVVRHLVDGSVVVDLTALEFLAISSLRSLLACEASADAQHRRVVYAAPPSQALRLLRLSGLDELLQLSANVTDASAWVAAD